MRAYEGRSRLSLSSFLISPRLSGRVKSGDLARGAAVSCFLSLVCFLFPPFLFCFGPAEGSFSQNISRKSRPPEPPPVFRRISRQLRAQTKRTFLGVSHSCIVVLKFDKIGKYINLFVVCFPRFVVQNFSENINIL